MKVIDLLNLVYEKKAPKKILYKYCKYEFDEETRDYQNKDGLYLFAYLFDNESQALTLEVEVLDEKLEKIEKIMQMDTRETRECIIKFQDKINEVIDNLNYLLEKSDKEC